MAYLTIRYLHGIRHEIAHSLSASGHVYLQALCLKPLLANGLASLACQLQTDGCTETAHQITK
jgi:hypothetical protein